MQTLKNLKLLVVVVGVAAIGTIYAGSVFASHSFELGVTGSSLPDNTHIRLDGLTLPPAGVLPVYDASPNFVTGHFLLRAPCVPVADGEDTFRPTITVIAGHIDEHTHSTHMDKMPLYYIAHASTAGSCVWHAHIPDPLNGGAPRVTDIDLINFSGTNITFNTGDVVDISVQRVLGSMQSVPYEDGTLPGELSGFNPVFDLNDTDTSNDGMGVIGEGGE
jgi:hypothetical protein